MKVHAIHIVNESYIFDIIFNVVKPFLSTSVLEKIFFHGSDLESLHKHIAPEYLPPRYGGTRPQHSIENWISIWRNNQVVFQELKDLGYEFSENEDANDV